MSLSKAAKLNEGSKVDRFNSLPNTLHRHCLWFLDFCDLQVLKATCRRMSEFGDTPPERWCKFQALWIGKATGKFYHTLRFLEIARPTPRVQNDWAFTLSLLRPRRCTNCRRLFSVEYADASVRKKRIRKALNLTTVCDLCFQELVCETRSVNLTPPIQVSHNLHRYATRNGDIHYYRVDELKQYIAKNGNPNFY
jgi:hypothetical protein